VPGNDLFDMRGDEIYFLGSPETWLHSIRRYQVAAGVNQLKLRVSMGNMPSDMAERTVTLLGERVLPHFLWLLIPDLLRQWQTGEISIAQRAVRLDAVVPQQQHKLPHMLGRMPGVPLQHVVQGL